MSKQQTKSKSVRFKYGQRQTGWLKRVKKDLKKMREEKKTD